MTLLYIIMYTLNTYTVQFMSRCSPCSVWRNKTWDGNYPVYGEGCDEEKFIFLEGTKILKYAIISLPNRYVQIMSGLSN